MFPLSLALLGFNCFVDEAWPAADVVVTRDLPYGSNFNNVTGEVQTLLLDIYEPPLSDNRTARARADPLSENSQEGAQALALSGGLRQTCRSNFVVVGVPVPVNHNNMFSIAALAPSYVPTGPMRAAVATRRAPNAAAIAVTRETADISTNAGTCVQVRHRRRPGRCPLISCTFTTTPRHHHDHLLATNAHLVLLPRRSGRRASLRTSPRSRAGSTRRRRRRRRRTSGSACTRTRASTTRTTTRRRTRRTRGDDAGSRGGSPHSWSGLLYGVRA